MVWSVPDEAQPDPEVDPIIIALRVAEVAALIFYCCVILVGTPNQGEVGRTWARYRARAVSWWARASAPSRARREAPYVVWEALQCLEGQ